MSRRPYLSDALAACGLFLACWGLVHTWFWAHDQLVDWPTYRDYGLAIAHHGSVPYRDFAVEYPPGALPVFVAPVVFGDYASAFAWLMAACGVALVAVVAAIDRRAAYYTALAPLLVGSLILSRFDLWPSLLFTAALGLLLAGRHGLGWGLLGAAVSAKLWPLVVVPLALVWSIRQGRGARALVGLAVVLIAFLPFTVLSPGGMWHSMSGQTVASAADREPRRRALHDVRASACRDHARLAERRRTRRSGRVADTRRDRGDRRSLALVRSWPDDERAAGAVLGRLRMRVRRARERCSRRST